MSVDLVKCVGQMNRHSTSERCYSRAVANFNFDPPEIDEPGPAEPPTGEPFVGTAESGDGHIRAVLSQDGRLQELHVASVLLRSAHVATEPTALTDKIIITVNAAMDDLLEKYRRTADETLAEVKNQMSTITEDFECELNQISTDIVRARQRLQEP